MNYKEDIFPVTGIHNNHNIQFDLALSIDCGEHHVKGINIMKTPAICHFIEEDRSKDGSPGMLSSNNRCGLMIQHFGLVMLLQN